MRESPSAPAMVADRGNVSHRLAPSPRGYLQLDYDPVKDRVYLPGGIAPVPCEDLACANALIDDLWSFDARSRAWTQLPAGLPPRLGDASALDWRSRQIIVFQPFFDGVQTWAYDVDRGTWENRQPATEPPGRWGSMATYDSRADRVLLYGGGSLADFSGLGDLWAYDYETNSWTERHPSGNLPPHHFTTLAYVPTIDRTILFGGYNLQDGSLFNDTWAYDYHRNRWTNLHPRNPPPARVYPYMGFEPSTNRLVMFGGVTDENDPNEPVSGETWIYDIADNRWSQAFPAESPSARAWHVVSGTKGPVMLFGGGPTRLTYTNETFLYSSRSNEWELVAGGTEAMAAHTGQPALLGGVPAGARSRGSRGLDFPRAGSR